MTLPAELKVWLRPWRTSNAARPTIPSDIAQMAGMKTLDVPPIKNSLPMVRHHARHGPVIDPLNRGLLSSPRWPWSSVRCEGCRRVGPATAERRPIVCIVDDRGIFGPVILHLRIMQIGFVLRLHGIGQRGAALARLHAHALFLSWQLVHCSGGSLPQALWPWYPVPDGPGRVL